MEELARLTPERSGADIEAICRRASLLALREWIAPQLPQGQVPEAKESDGTSSSTGNEAGQQSAEPALPTNRFEIRPEHFARAMDEQRERYAVQEEAEETITKQEEGRQHLMEMAADYDPAMLQQQRASITPVVGVLVGLLVGLLVAVLVTAVLGLILSIALLVGLIAMLVAGGIGWVVGRQLAKLPALEAAK